VERIPAHTHTREPYSFPQTTHRLSLERKNGTENGTENGKKNGKRKPLSINSFRHFFPFFRLFSALLPQIHTPPTRKNNYQLQTILTTTTKTKKLSRKTEKRKNNREIIERVRFPFSVSLSVSIPFFRFKRKDRVGVQVSFLPPLSQFFFYAWCQSFLWVWEAVWVWEACCGFRGPVEGSCGFGWEPAVGSLWEAWVG
jgi:hypothetical protein